MCYFLLTFIVFDDRSAYEKPDCFSPIKKVPFLTHCFQDILSFLFKSLIIIELDVKFFWLILFVVCSASWICSFMPFAKFGKSSVYFFKCFFSPVFFFFSFQDSNDTNVRPFVIVPWVPKDFHPPLYFFCYLNWAIYIVLLSGSLYTVSSILVLSLSINFLIVVIAFLSSKFPFHFSLYLLFLPQDFLFSHLFQVGLGTFTDVLVISMMVVLKYLSDNSNICHCSLCSLHWYHR